VVDNAVINAVSLLKNGKIMLYPTDTIWGIGCDATNEFAIEKIFYLKNRPAEKSLILLVDSVALLKQYVDINNEVEVLISTFNTPTTVIYSNPRNIPKIAVNADNTIAIRIVKHSFCSALIKQLGKPIVSTSANISGYKNPVFFEDIASEIKQNVDFIVDKIYDTSKHKTPSRLIKLNADYSVVTLR